MAFMEFLRICLLFEGMLLEIRLLSRSTFAFGYSYGVN